MRPRFTLIQGGLPEMAPRVVLVGGYAERESAIGAAFAGAPAPAGWRVELRRPAELREAEIEEWRALAARTTNLDPFADPDFLVTSALHMARGIAFALAFCTGDAGIERLRGVIPLEVPHPIRSGSSATLWQAPLAPRPIGPVLADGAAGDAIAALLDHLGESGARVSLRLSGIAASGALLADLRTDARFRLVDHPVPPSIPEAQFVSVGAGNAVTRTERITAPDRIEDAVERLLLGNVHQPQPFDSAAAMTVRVVSRLFARRGLIEVALHTARGRTVSAAIHLGRAGERVLWRSFNPDAAPIRPLTADIEIVPAGVVKRTTPLRLVVS